MLSWVNDFTKYQETDNGRIDLDVLMEVILSPTMDAHMHLDDYFVEFKELSQMDIL